MVGGGQPHVCHSLLEPTPKGCVYVNATTTTGVVANDSASRRVHLVGAGTSHGTQKPKGVVLGAGAIEGSGGVASTGGRSLPLGWRVMFKEGGVAEWCDLPGAGGHGAGEGQRRQLGIERGAGDGQGESLGRSKGVRGKE